MLHVFARDGPEGYVMIKKIAISFIRNRIHLAAVILACAVVTAPLSIVNADPPTTKPTLSESAAEESLNIRHARAHLELAELDLRRALQWNKRIPDLFSDRTIAYLRKHVEIDGEQLSQSIAHQNPDAHEIYIRGAQAAVELADADVQRRQAIYKSFPDNFHALELDRAIAVAKVAKLSLERTVAKKGSIDTLSQLQWQVEELRNQLLELQIKMEGKVPRWEKITR